MQSLGTGGANGKIKSKYLHGYAKSFSKRHKLSVAPHTVPWGIWTVALWAPRLKGKEHLGQSGKIFLAHSKLCQTFTWIKRVETKSILLPVWICWIWGYVRMKRKHKFFNVYNFIRLWVNLSILNLNKRHFGLKSRHSYADAMISYTFKVFYVIEHWLGFFILQSWLIMAWIFKTYIVTVDLYTYKTFLRPRIRPLS